MTNANATDTPVEATVGVAEPGATETFALLGNETRLAILLALWEVYDPYADANAVSFSELYDRVEYDTTANFSYHLEKLEGQFVRKTDAGYELRRAGHQFVRAAVAGAGIEEPTLEPTEIDVPCVLCGSPTVITYDDGWLYQSCTECEGHRAASAERPEGYLTGMELDPVGLLDRTPEEIFAGAVLATKHRLTSVAEGLCPECSGSVESSIHVCEGHDPDGICGTCGRRREIAGRYRCTVCKRTETASPKEVVAVHPAVTAFYYEHGVEFAWELADVASVEQALALVATHEQELVSVDPPRVRVTVRYGGDAVELVLDETLSVVSVSE